MAPAQAAPLASSFLLLPLTHGWILLTCLSLSLSQFLMMLPVQPVLLCDCRSISLAVYKQMLF